MITIHVNGEPLEVSANATVTDLLSQLDLVGKRLAVEYNKEILPRSEHGSTALQAQDQLEIVQAIGGG